MLLTKIKNLLYELFKLRCYFCGEEIKEEDKICIENEYLLEKGDQYYHYHKDCLEQLKKLN